MNEEVEILGLGMEPKKTVVTGVEMFHKSFDQADAGMNV
jgi:elongation factor Tu